MPIARHALTYLPLTVENVHGVKRALSSCFTEFRSSHLSEALAAALGHRTHAALLAAIAKPSVPPCIVALDEVAFSERLSNLSETRVTPAEDGVELFGSLQYPVGTVIIPTWSAGFDEIKYETGHRLTAWRNVMVAGVNAGLDQDLFTMLPGGNHWPGSAADASQPIHLYRFDVDGIPALGAVRDIGFDELRVHIALWPTPDAEQWVGVMGAGFRAGDVIASGWIERRDGAYLQVSRKPDFSCRKPRRARVDALDIQPLCYADRGSFRM